MPRVIQDPSNGYHVQWDNGYRTQFDGQQLLILYLRQFGQDAACPVTNEALAAMPQLPAG
jgi:hypothetical protein